ncbi:TetR/AcrR family transcriptional regulator [Naumannella halotolerans]|uniref:AcrR family transcriptional regulator n=1 Tax=Naumannella halotolerans TaxID=993414 RepID=A0A4R7JBA9_9ACTN|nr:TetR/AcrR family transcriptional regulator [Naumannella halotolerans]TDT33947.1 AcrR family transcriptional regulator [Naumannella halotolerans]
MQAKKSSPGRGGIVAAAARQFSEHGINGTSLQQIADAAGVTKAAVYHHYRSKNDIVRAVLAPALDDLSAIVRRARQHATAGAQVESAVIGLADHTIANRQLWALLMQDPAAADLIHTDPDGQAVFASLRDVLTGPTSDPAGTIAVSMFLWGLTAPFLDPRLAADVDDETLRGAIVAAGRRLLEPDLRPMSSPAAAGG